MDDPFSLALSSFAQSNIQQLRTSIAIDLHRIESVLQSTPVDSPIFYYYTGVIDGLLGAMRNLDSLVNILITREKGG